MLSYIFRRFLLMLPTLVGIMTICFFISEFVPGGPIDQVRAQLEGKDKPAGEVGGSGGKEDQRENNQLNSKDEMILLRQFGYHTTRLERYFRTILWFSPDSISSSKELGDERDKEMTAETIVDSSPFFRGETKGIIVRVGQEYYAYEAIVPNTEIEVYFDKAAKVFRDVKTGTLSFDYKTGKVQVKEGENLAPLALVSLPIYRKTAERTEKTSGLVAQDRLKYAQLQVEKNPKVAKYSKDGKHEFYTYSTLFGTVECEWNGDVFKKKEIYEEIYLEQPLMTQLLCWDNWHGYFLFKFGSSIHYAKPAYELIVERLPVSMRLGIISFIITYTGCLTLGVSKAVRNGSRFDLTSSMIVLAGYSIPGFVLAVVLKAMFGEGESALINLFPNGGLYSVDYADLSFWGKICDSCYHLVLPITCFIVGSFATLTFFTKNNVLNETHQLYAIAARARGLSERRVLFKHILRNALVPLITVFPSSFLMMFFGGSMLIEKIFNLQGIGLLGYEAIMGRDFPVVMGDLFLFSLLGLVAKLITDIGYVIADPRISFDSSNN